MLSIIFLPLFCTFPTLNADVSEFFDNNLTIEMPLGTLFPGEKAQFACHAKNWDGNGQLIWHWHFPNRSTHSIIDPVEDVLKESDSGLIRQSVIQIPNTNFRSRLIAFIGCELARTDHPNHKLMPVDIFQTLQPPSKHNRREGNYPQIALEIYGSLIRKPLSSSTDNYKSYRHPPNLVTNQTIHLSTDAKSVRLTCLIRKEDAGLHEWAIAREDENVSDIIPEQKTLNDNANKISLILNKIALIYREAIISGRLPPYENPCHDNATNSSRFLSNYYNDPTTTSEMLEVILPPVVEQSQKLIYTCRPKVIKDGTRTTNHSGSAHVEITLRATRSMVEKKDQDFLELVQILTQILQSSGPSGGSPEAGSGSGSGPIYGVGFGSSTIMILMGLTIYYLKRQLNQIQEQVKEHEERKKLRKKSRNDEDDSEL